jgi:putative phage-type endonuclease
MGKGKQMPIYHEFEQRSAEWFQARLGIPTASEFDRIITPKTRKPSAQAEKYMNRLLAEWVLGEPIEEADFLNSYMDRGTELEDSAVKAFEFQAQLKTRAIGLVTTDDGLIACSPDRLVEDMGTLEIKCPSAPVHIAYLRSAGSASVAEEYFCQIQGQLMICQLERSFLISHHPKLPPIVLQITRDDDFIRQLEAALKTFVDVMLSERQRLEHQFGPFTRPEDRIEARKNIKDLS